MDNYHRGHFDQSGSFSDSAPASYQSRFQSNSISAHRYNLDYHEQHPASQAPDHPDKKSNRFDEDARQRTQDEQWINTFLHRRRKTARPPSPSRRSPLNQSVSDFREQLYTAVKMLSQLSEVCQTLKNNLENESSWTDSYAKAAELKSSLEESLKTLRDPHRVDVMKKKLALIKKRRARVRRKKAEREEEKCEQEARAAEKEAAIDKHQMKKIQEIEIKNRVRGLYMQQGGALGWKMDLFGDGPPCGIKSSGVWSGIRSSFSYKSTSHSAVQHETTPSPYHIYTSLSCLHLLDFLA